MSEAVISSLYRYFSHSPVFGTRATLETAYIRRGVLNVRIHGDNHVLTDYASASISSPIATLRRLGPGPSQLRAAPRPIRATIQRIEALCAVLSSLRRLRGKILRRGRDNLSRSRS